MNLIGCHYQKQMNPGDYTFDENSTMKITTKDSVYNFNEDDYYLRNDTLYGNASEIIDDSTTQKFNVEIPVEYMEGVEVDRFDVAGTILTVLGSLAGIFFLVMIIGISDGPFADWK
jgi:hypothetical protein